MGKCVVECTSILVPTDFSDKSLVALDYGRVLAARSRGTLHVLHVVPPAIGVGGATFWACSHSDRGNRLEEEARHQLEAITPELDGRKVNTGTLVGHPSVEIVHYARDRNVDLIVMGTQGRGLLARLLLGSVVESVTQRAPCPVLVVHAPGPSVGPF